MAFHEVRFPTNLSFGSAGGPERRTEIVTLTNGFEERNTPWSASRHRYDAGLGLRSMDDIEVLIAFFEARQGQLYGFRWKDWADFKSCTAQAQPGFADQTIGTGDGSTTVFALRKSYHSGAASYVRDVRKPVEGTVRAGVAGTESTEGTDFTVDASAGTVAFAVAPAAGSEVTAGFEFDVPVRFDTDRILTSVASFQAGDAPSVPVVEIRL